MTLIYLYSRKNMSEAASAPSTPPPSLKHAQDIDKIQENILTVENITKSVMMTDVESISTNQLHHANEVRQAANELLEQLKEGHEDIMEKQNQIELLTKVAEELETDQNKHV